MRHGILLFIYFLTVIAGKAQTKGAGDKVSAGRISYKAGKLLYKDQFNGDLKNWVSEYVASPASSVTVKDRKLVIDVDGGATVWFNKVLKGNIMITYKRKVIMDSGRNDRLSDLNQFWMASDPKRKNLFTRTGEFSKYDSLSLYYAGIGGNSNTTSRFRKYTGDGKRILLFDLVDTEHLLVANKVYGVRIVVYKGVTSFFLDDKPFFTYHDERPLKAGYFGFRTTESRQEIDD